MYDTSDTIAAIATSAGHGARGIIRISGPDAVQIAGRCFAAHDGRPLERHRSATALAGRVTVVLSRAAPTESRAVTFDCALFLWPGTRSYTRQPVAEFHTLGSQPLMEAVLAALCRAGARLAEPGEFTLRAFLAGRLDLTQAEAVLGLIDARVEDEFSAALAQLAGGLRGPLVQLRDDLLQLLAELEAGLDFIEEDIQFISSQQLLERLDSARQLLDRVDGQLAGRSTSESFDQVVLVGPPNVGKSSLFNALVARNGAASGGTSVKNGGALVSPVHGTTRDYLTAKIELRRIACELVDTAGVESIGANSVRFANEHAAVDLAAQRIASERRQRASIRVFCVDASAPAAGWDFVKSVGPVEPQRDIVVRTKADLRPPATSLGSQYFALDVSSVTGKGLFELSERIGQLLANGTTREAGQAVAATAERCRESVRLAGEGVRRAAEIVADELGNELAAAEIRVAIQELGKVVGAVYTDDLLDRIFRTFCIGK